MYELVLSQQNMLIISLILGVLFGVTYDILRGIRMVIPHKDIFIYLEDIVYWFLWTAAVIYVIQSCNYGVLRLYIFIAIVIGLVLYLLTVSKLYIYLLLKIIFFTKKLFKKVNKLLKNVAKKVKMIITVKRYRKSNGDRK